MRQRCFPRLVVMAATLAIALPAMAQAQDPWVGTWKLNLAKSKYEPANLAPRSTTITQAAMPGGGSKITTDGVDSQGRATHTDTTTMFDGKPSVVTGAPDANTTRVYRRVDGRTYEYVQSVAGKVTTTARTVVAADGKVRTITTTGKDAQGRTINNVAVYDRQ
jgi:hypothetical protein